MKKQLSIFLIVTILLGIFIGTGSVALAAGESLDVQTTVTEMVEGGSVEFDATVTAGDTALSDYVIKCGSTVCYDSGGAPLAAGESKDVTFNMDVSESMLDNPINFTLYSGGSAVSGATDSVTIAKKELSIAIGFTATASQTLVDSGKTVKFSFTVENQGEAALENIVISAPELNGGAALNSPFSLQGGESAPVTYSHTVTAAVTVNPVASYSASGTSQPDKTHEPIEIKLTSRKVVPKITVDNKTPNAGEEVTFTLTVDNEGNVTYTDVTVYLNGEEVSFPVSKLEGGKSYEETYTRSYQTSTDVQFKISLKDHYGTLLSVGSNTINIQLPIDPDSLTAKLRLDMNVDRPQLTSAGTINFTGYISNASEYTLSDISVDETSLGNIFGATSMAPGAKENISWTADINETTTYNFELTAKDRDGVEYTVAAEPITVTISSAVPVATPFDDAAEVTPEPGTTLTLDGSGGGDPLGLWAVIAIILVVLIIGVGVALIILWKKGQSPKRTTSSQMAKKKAPAKGFPKPRPRKKSGPKGYRDRNNF